MEIVETTGMPQPTGFFLQIGAVYGLRLLKKQTQSFETLQVRFVLARSCLQLQDTISGFCLYCPHHEEGCGRDPELEDVEGFPKQPESPLCEEAPHADVVVNAAGRACTSQAASTHTFEPVAGADSAWG